MLKSLVFRLSTCALLFALTSLVSMASLADSNIGTIRGTVTSGGSPINGILVCLYAQGIKQPVDATVTDASGVYEFTDEPPGNYVIKIGFATYRDEICDVTASQKVTSMANLEASTILGDVNGRSSVSIMPPNLQS